MEEIDITPASNNFVPRTAIIGPGVDPSSTRTFLPMALHTSDNIYNQKLSEISKMMKMKPIVKNSNDTLPYMTDVNKLIGNDSLSEEIEKESYQRLMFNGHNYGHKPGQGHIRECKQCKETGECECKRCKEIIEQTNMNNITMDGTDKLNDELGEGTKTFNEYALEHVVNDDLSPSGKVAVMFDDYLKNNTEEQPLGTHFISETPLFTNENKTSINNGDNDENNDNDSNGELELTEMIGNGKVLINNVQPMIKDESSSLSSIIILCVAILMFGIVLVIYFTNVTNINNSHFQNFVQSHNEW